MVATAGSAGGAAADWLRLVSLEPILTTVEPLPAPAQEGVWVGDLVDNDVVNWILSNDRLLPAYDRPERLDDGPEEVSELAPSQGDAPVRVKFRESKYEF